MSYTHKDIETKWQDRWESAQIFRAKIDRAKPKYYVLDMFPYPSAQGLHVGHPEGYTATDIIARYKRAKGFNVLHPMGWDAFGLPAEQYAIKTGTHPEITTKEAMENFRRQLKSFGFSFDWSREISTCDPKYYKWTQWIFLKLFEKGLAYQKEVPVNWCPALRTVLANEEVIDGKSERGNHPVVRVLMKQWMLRITAYAERLSADLDKVDWPQRSKDAQRNWIGKSEGARVHFSVKETGDNFEIFTTRPDTLFGVTFMVLAPENPMVNKITTPAQKMEITEYQEVASRKSDIDRQIGKDKTGVFTGAHAVHPLTQELIPIWISDYVMMDYGTGAIMAVPGHDARDFEFAEKFNLNITRVIDGGDLPFEGDGKLANSHFLNGLDKAAAIEKMISHLESKKIGVRQIQYRLRDWLFSRQRYWGEPFPIVNFPKRGLHALPFNELPLLLPKVAEYMPSEKGESPLANNPDWVEYKDSQSGETGERITDTMPGSAGSSWYFLRYTDPQNENEPFSFDAQNYWMPVDLYLGGAEHTVGHLLYARFWQKVLFDAGLVSTDEPFHKLVHQGMILGEDGEKMSKSRGNVINPDIVIEKYGADTLRMYEMFMGPLDRDKPWATSGLEGVRRFLDRIWRLSFDGETGAVLLKDEAPSEVLKKVLHKTIKKVTDDIESLAFNTAISQMMILLNEVSKSSERPCDLFKTLAQLLMPFAPHFAEELWEKLGGNGFVSQATWPTYDPALIVEDRVEIGVQVNGKMRGAIALSPQATEEEALALAIAIPGVRTAINGNPIKKVIYKAGKILNLIAN